MHLRRKWFMSIHKIVLTIAVASAFLMVPHSSRAQLAKGPLANVKSIKCTFPVMAVGTWGDKEPEVKVKQSTRELQFDAINTDEGTATSMDLKAGYGKYDIIVRYAGGYLHFIQSFLDG